MSNYDKQEIKQNTKFLKIEAGAPMVIRLLDESPVEAMKHSTGKTPVDGKFQVECKGDDICPFCQDGDEPMQKLITNVFNHTFQKVQLWEYGPMIGKMLKKIAINLAEEGKDIMNFDLKVEAEGAQMQKKYTVTLRTSQQQVPIGIKKIRIGEDIPF